MVAEFENDSPRDATLSLGWKAGFLAKIGGGFRRSRSFNSEWNSGRDGEGINHRGVDN